MIQKAQFAPARGHWIYKPVGLFKERITRQQLRELLLNYPDPVVDGLVRQWQHKHLGVGVYELRVKP